MPAIFTGDYKKKLPVWGASLLFFGTVGVVFGVGIYPDSDTYIQMQAKREPLYPLFLHLCGNLSVAVILQNLLAAGSVAYFTCTMQELFLEKLKKGWKWFGTAVLWLCALMPHLMTPLGSASHMILSNSILTEGLTYPFYLFFSTELVKGLLETEERHRKTALFKGLVWVFLLLMLRNQMLTTLFIWAVVAVYMALTRKKEWKQRAAACGEILLAVLLVILAKNLCYHTYYNHYCNGYSGENLGNIGFLANTLYLVDETEAIEVQNEELLDSYRQLLETRKTEGLYFIKESNVLKQALQYEDCYDPLKYEVIQPILEEKLYADGVTGQEVNEQLYQQCGVLFQALLPHVTGEYLALVFDNLCLGLIRTVSLPHGLFVWIGVLGYTILIGLLIYKSRKKRDKAVQLLLLLALGMTLLHTAATAAVIMCLSRYVIYNTTLLYSAGFLALLEEMIEKRKNGLKWDTRS